MLGYRAVRAVFGGIMPVLTLVGDTVASQNVDRGGDSRVWLPQSSRNQETSDVGVPNQILLSCCALGSGVDGK